MGLNGDHRSIILTLTRLFLVQPGIFGWMATAAVTGFGLLAAFWVQRTRSLRTAVAAHASYNATLILCILVFR